MEREHPVVGKPLPRIDGPVKATGQAEYTDDLALPQMLHGKILRSPHPHARIINIDTSRAERLPGVKAVVTGKDTAGIRYGMVDGLPPDMYPLAVDKVRYVGDEVAAVAAADEETAEEALGLIRVDYELLPAVFDPEEALKDDAPQVHEGFIPSPPTVWEDIGLVLGKKPDSYKVSHNICATFSRSHGDIEKGFKESDYIRSDRFVIPMTAHCALEPHVALADFDSSGNLQVWMSHMGYERKRQYLAAALGIPLNKVRVLKAYVGGGFGGKVMLFSCEFLAAFLSRKTGRPVKIVMSREEVFAATQGDMRMTVDVKTGAMKDGTLVAQEIKVLNDAGAYRGSSLIAMRLVYSKTIPIYNIPNMKCEGICVYTNKSVCGPKRGHGTPQVAFAAESQMDIIAEELGIDPLELRLKNVRKEGDTLPNGDRLASCGLVECIKKAVEAGGWRERHGKRENHGIGIGVSAAQSSTNLYPYGSSAVVKINPDGSITLFTGAVETGQGSDTAMCQIAAEEMGLALEDVRLVSADSELCPTDLGNYIMGGVYVTGEAVRLAAADARRQLLEEASRVLEIGVEELGVKHGSIYIKENPEKLVPFSTVLKLSQRDRDVIIGKGYRKAGPKLESGFFSDAYTFTVAVAEVEVDKQTGMIRLLRIILAHDGGFAINPLNVEGQIEGQLVMGQGDMQYEEILIKDGQMINSSFLDYKMPLSLDAVEIILINADAPDLGGPYGAKEAGECARSPLLPAVSNAIYNAIGVRFRELPLTPDRILAASRVL